MMVTNEQLCISATIAQFTSWSCWTPRCWGSWDIQPASRTTCSQGRSLRNKAWHRWFWKLWQHDIFGLNASEHSLLHHLVAFYPWVNGFLSLNIQSVDESGLSCLYWPNRRLFGVYCVLYGGATPTSDGILNKDHIATVITFQFGEDEKQIAIYINMKCKVLILIRLSNKNYWG